jgi:hypothetical protein
VKRYYRVLLACTSNQDGRYVWPRSREEVGRVGVETMRGTNQHGWWIALAGLGSYYHCDLAEANEEEYTAQVMIEELSR